MKEPDFERYMHRSLALAGIALKQGNPPVGAVIVLKDKIIGEGIESGKLTGDITNHAEILAIRDAIQNGYSKNLSESKMFTTHEPCIMCSYLIRHHKIPHIIFGSPVPLVGGVTSEFPILATEKIPMWGTKPLITTGICTVECAALTKRFLNKKQTFITTNMENKRYPMPPFTLETALQKVQAAEDAWNTKDPEKVSLAYTLDTEWRNRNVFLKGREEVKAFLTQKWHNELDYKLKKELWCFLENKIAVRFEYEWHNQTGQWFRSYGNENWEFDENGLMTKRFASINDLPISEDERKLI